MICLKCRTPIKNRNDIYGLHQSCFVEWFKVPNDARFLSLVRKTSKDSESSFVGSNSSFFQGKFKKYSAILNNESYIIKMREEGATEIPEVEYLCNEIAKSLGINTPAFYLINFEGDNVFVTKNFMFGMINADLKHIYHFREIKEHNCKKLISLIKKMTNRPYDVNLFIKTVLYDALIGNHDRHGRNLAFIASAQGYKLSPSYDNVTYLALEQGNFLKADFEPKGKIATSKTLEPSMKDYVNEFIDLNYKDQVEKFYSTIRLSKIRKIIKSSYCSNLMKVAILRLIEKRFKELKDGLKV